MEELSLAVVGIAHPNAHGGNRRFELLLCTPGDTVDLRPEPRNRHDARAVAVFSERGIQVGYLTAERAPWIGARIRAGDSVAAIFQELQQHGAVIRVRFGGGAPTLPKPGPRAACDPERDINPDPDHLDQTWPAWPD